MPKILSFFSFFIPALLILVGLGMAGVAVKFLLESTQSLECFCPSCHETALASKGADSLGLIRVDIQGAVKKPGIYQLEIGQRMADLLALAGGFAKNADRAYVAKTLNLATELKNQDKIYIPFLEEAKPSATPTAISSGATGNTSNSSSQQTTATSKSNLISVNNADSATLQSLSGIGEVRAKAIIDGRPYANLDELVGKGVLSQSLFTSLQGQISL